LGVVLVDLMSKAGVKVDDKTIDPCIPVSVKNGVKIQFGLSTRIYEVNLDFSKMQKAVEIEKKNLEREMRLLEQLDRPDLDIETVRNTLGLVKDDTVYVSNLPYSCTEKDLRDLFGDCGTIMAVRLPENR
jgi:RNA recognition motif-containing protein